MKIKIGSKFIAKDSPVFIIAEAGVNHNGKLSLAKKLVDAAVAAGADAVKFQTFTTNLVVTAEADEAPYQRKNIGRRETQAEMLKGLELSRADFRAISSYCRKKKIIFLSTPFSEADADFLQTLNVPAYKTSSGDLDNLPFLKHLAKKGKPLIISSGMSSLAELKTAVKAVNSAGNRRLVLLHCTANYPAADLSLNLRAIKTMADRLGVLVGYSDHSRGILASVLAVGLGACLIEKHFTLSRKMAGPDHKASLEPRELKELVESVRRAEIMLGSGEKRCEASELESKISGRRSLVALRKIRAGEKISAGDLIMKRPGTGISPAELNRVIGRRAKRDINKDKTITWAMIK